MGLVCGSDPGAGAQERLLSDQDLHLLIQGWLAGVPPDSRPDKEQITAASDAKVQELLMI